MNHLSSITVIAVLSTVALIGRVNGFNAIPQPVAQQAAPAVQQQKGAARNPPTTPNPANPATVNGGGDVKDTSAPVPPATPPAPPLSYVPSAEEAKDLLIAQQDAQLAQSAYAAEAQKLPSFAAFQASVAQLQKECTAVRLANKWPDSVQCDIQQKPVKFCAQMVVNGSGQLGCPTADTVAKTSAK